MANLMRLTKQELIAKLTTSENLVKYQDEQIQDVNNRAKELTLLVDIKNEEIKKQSEMIVNLNKELISHKESLKLKVDELNSLLNVKDKGIKEQAEMIVKLNKELDVYKDSLFTASNAVDDYICKLNIAKAKITNEKSLHKYYFIGGALSGIILYFLLTLLF